MDVPKMRHKKREGLRYKLIEKDKKLDIQEL